MSFQLNSDREQLRGVDSTIIGSSSVRIRAGQGTEEREIFQTKVDPSSGLPRVGINRTGRRVDFIKVTASGQNYTDTPTVEISAPTLPGGIQAVASATTDAFGRITSIGIDNQGDGYEFAPTVNITGGGGTGAAAEAALDIIEFELDVNGAIRTSTSIISDTANILNLDIDNLVTPDIKIRAPHLKTFMNGGGEAFPTSPTPVNKNDYFYVLNNVYQALNNGVTGNIPPFHDDGIELNGTVQFKHIGYRIEGNPDVKFYGEGGNAGVFPRSITPLLGDKSDKIATTEYVLNLATNDVGGRIYVSEQIGDDDNDGRSPVNPVRTIKKACQLAWQTPGVKESVIVAGGNYIEDNPISIPPDCSIVGDNLRLVIIRPNNLNKHIFKFGDKNYVIGVTYQDKVNSSGASVGTWDFAMVFDDKQRITYDAEANGDFGINFPVGHQFFGPESFSAQFAFNSGGASLSSGIQIFGVSTGTLGRIGAVTFDITDTNNQNVYLEGSVADLVKESGAGFQSAETFLFGGTGTTFWKGTTDYDLGDVVFATGVDNEGGLIANVYTVVQEGTSGITQPDHTSGQLSNGTVIFEYTRAAYSVNFSEINSTRAEGEVVFVNEDQESILPIIRVDFSQQGTFTDGFQSDLYGNAEDLGGVIFYTNPLEGANNIHDFKEGDEIEITGMPVTGSYDLTFLNGKQRIYKVLEDADGRARRFVIPKKIPTSFNLELENNWNPDDYGAVVSVKYASKSVTLSLLNSPNKFPLATPVARRYQDACLQIRNNRDFIADEVVGRINDQFKKEYFSVYDIDATDPAAVVFKVFAGTSTFVHTYVSGGTVTVTATGNTYNISNFEYDNTTGVATITTSSNPGLVEDDTVQLADILVSCVISGEVVEKTYPSWNIPVSDEKCKRDVRHFLNALTQDLEFGSNYNIIKAAQRYFDAGQIEYVDYEIIQTVRAIEYARELAIYAMRKWRTGDGSPGQTVYVPSYASQNDQYIDQTIIDDPATPACANVYNAIQTLSYLYVDVIANNASGTYLDAAYLISRNKDHIADEAYLRTKQQYPSLALNNIDERKCRRDINYIITGVLRDLVLGGNTGAVSYAELYYTGTGLTGIPASELGATRFAFQKVRDLSIQAMRNWTTSAGNPVSPLFTLIPQFTDNTILVDANGTPTFQGTPTDATYDPATGDFVMTFAAPHGVTTNESIRIEIESFVFKCAMDNYRSEHYLPESDQTAATQLIPVDSVTANTITINVGASGSDVTFTPTDATYDPSTGNFTMEIGAHTLSLGEGIVLDDNSFTFRCAMDGYDSQKTYPRPGIDPFAGRSMKITGSTETSITVNVGASGPNKTFQPSDATYNPATGDMVVTVGQHGLGVGRSVVLSDNSFTFTCDMDNNATEKSYPRPGIDPFAGKSIAITSVGVTTHSPSNASYDPAAGTLQFTLVGHGFSNGDYIKIDDNAITFTCDLDGNASQHTYPRSYEYASGRWFAVQVIDADTLQITGLPIPRDQSTHTYVSFAPNSLSRQDGTFTINVGTSDADVEFTPTNATYDPSNGDLELTIGSHSLVAGEGIVIADNSLSFSCDMDNRDSTKTYPRPGIDPYAGRSIPITSVTANTITVNAGVSGPNKYFTPTAATYSPVTGDMTVTVGQHGLGVGRSVVLEDNSFTFTCLTDPSDPKTYPRPGQDPFAGKSIPITAVGSTSHDVTDAPYNPSTGIITLTVANHGFSNGDYIKVADGSLTYTCDLDGNTVQKSYPRAGYDYPSGRWLQINGVTTNTFQINVGPSSYTGTHTYVGGTASNAIERQDGTFTIFVGTSSDTSTHTFVSATTNAIKHEPQSTHYFEGATANSVKHLPQSTHTFVRATSNAIKHEPQSTHQFVSATTGAVKHLPQSAHDFQRVIGTNVVAAYPSGGSPVCADVEASLTTSFALIDGILEFAADPDSPTAIQPGTTTKTTGTLFTGDSIISYPTNVLRDANNNYVTIRGIYDDLPIISASPYTQNSSIISKLGGSGALIDGSKVKSPNCPFPGLSDGKATFPNQGKSMVASAFTIVSEQNGIGYKVIEDGYTQLVSVFCIFTVDGILCESGGYASVTNSASNFGTYALRSVGIRREPYEFDAGYSDSQGYQRAFIDVVSESITGFTEFTIDNLGRIPLEHYVVRVDGYESADLDDEYFIDKVEVLREGPPFRARVTLTDGSGAGTIQLRNKSTGLTVSPASLSQLNVALHRPSICNSSSHTWEFVGSGVDYNALPENGGIKVDANEQVSENYGRTYVSGTDELGDFKVGTFAKIENRTGNITFTGTVSISEVEFLKLRGGDVVVTGFDNSNTLGGTLSSDSKLPTQKAVRDYIINNLGQYLNKNYSTNPVPRALVELTDSGLISESQLPASSPIEVYTVEDQAARLALEGIRAGDIAIQDGEAYILNTDSESLFAGIAVDSSLQFTANAIFTGSNTGGKIQLTEYRQGVVKRITIPDGGGGSGYSTSNPPTVVITDTGTTLGHVPATAEAVVAGGEIVAINITESNGYFGGQGYSDVPTISFTNTGGGSGASANAEIESRLYGNIVNAIKINATDTIESSDVPSETVNIIRTVNTSGSNNANWVSLSTSSVPADRITDGPIPTGILANNSTEANSNTALFGDQSYKKVVKSVRGSEERYFITTADASGSDYLVFLSTSQNNTGLLLIGHQVTGVTGIQPGTTITQIADITVGTDTFKRVTLSDGLTNAIPTGSIVEFIRPPSPILLESTSRTSGFIESVQIENGGQDFAQDEGGTFNYNNVEVLGGVGTIIQRMQLNFRIESGVVTNVTVAQGGEGYEADFTITDIPTEIGTEGSGLILRAKVNTTDKQEGDIGIDVARVTSDTLSDEDFGTVGVARFKKSQFDVGDNGSVALFTGIDSGLDADLLDGNQSTYYRNADNINAGRLKPAYLSGEYNISITQQSGSTAKLTAKTGSLTSDLPPNDIIDGITADVRRNDANQLFDPATKEVDGVIVSTATDYNTVLSFRGGGSGTTNPYGGVGQIAFTDANNFYARGSSARVDSEAQWSAWAKIWTSQNDYTTDPVNTADIAGPNAYRLRNRTGLWYQNANTFIFGDLGDRRLPSYQTAKDFNTRLRVLEDTGAGLRYDIYIGTVTAATITAFDNAPFTSNPPLVKLLDAFGNDPGEIRVSNIEVYNNDGTVLANRTAPGLDYSQLYAVVTGTLEVGGSFETSGGDPVIALGDNTVQIGFDDYSISSFDGNADGMPDGNVEVVRLESVAGEGKLVIGRADGAQGSATSPAIWFRSSDTIPQDTTGYYTVRMVATGGDANAGSGALDVQVATPNSFTVGSNIIWNEGNVVFNTTNTASTTDQNGDITIKSAVFRDENGDFAANVITADLTGTASGNLDIDGGTLQGDLYIGTTGSPNDLYVRGNTLMDGTAKVDGDFTVDYDGNLIFADVSESKVGIGTASFPSDEPTAKLVVQGAATSSTSFLVTGGGANIGSALKLQHQGATGSTGTDGTWNIAFGANELDFGVGQNSVGAAGGMYLYHKDGNTTNVPLILKTQHVVIPFRLGVGNNSPGFGLDVSDNARIDTSLTIGKTNNNNGAPIYFLGATGGSYTDGYLSNFRVGNQISGDDIFEITAGDHGDANNEWKATPALAIQGSNNRVAINTTAFGGTDPEEVDEFDNPIQRVYTLNIQGDVNFNGQLFKDNAEFVTSRWTEAPNEIDIYRPSKVGINFTTDKNPGYALDVEGSVDINTSTVGVDGDTTNANVLRANGDPQWLDTYGVIKANRNSITENITIPNNINAMSVGPIEVGSGNTITVDDGGVWTIL